MYRKINRTRNKENMHTQCQKSSRLADDGNNIEKTEAQEKKAKKL